MMKPTSTFCDVGVAACWLIRNKPTIGIPKLAKNIYCAILRFLRSSFSLVSTRIRHLPRHEVGQIATTPNFSAYNVAKPLRRQNTPRAWEAIRIPDDGAIQILWSRADAVGDRRYIQASSDNTRLLIELHV